METSPIVIFHQRQKWLRCGLHAVNNLLQKDVATPQDFDEISSVQSEIAGKGPLLSRFGLGDYDANTVIEFLQNRASCVVSFIDRRRARESIQQCVLDEKLKGFLVNVQGKRRWLPAPIASFRHWYAVVRIGHSWYKIDSSERQVRQLEDVIDYLETVQKDDQIDTNLLAVKESSEPPY